MVYTLYLTLLGSAMMFIVLNHPISLGLVLIAHTLLISVVTGVVGGHFWFSYILFLVFLGGVLVLFIYMTSLASNEKFTFDWMGLLTLTLVVGMAMIGVLLGLLPSSEAPPMVADWIPSGLEALVMKLYSAECFKITGLLILYLLYALMVCASIVNKYSGALRNFN